MKIAVLMSTYNGEKYLEQQIESILAQNGDFELNLIVRDDGSNDRTKEILQKYSDCKKLRWYDGENLRSAKSFMHLLYNCGQYDFYCFCDQDDFWKPEKIRSGVNALANVTGPAVYYSNAELVDKHLKSFGTKVYKRIPHTDLYTVICSANVLGCTMICNSSLVELIREKEMPQTITMHDSYVARVCLAVGGSLIYEDVAHILYRQHENNVLGIRAGILEKLRQKIKDVLHKEQITLDEQAVEILRLYGDLMPEENRIWMDKVAHYRDSFVSRCLLAFSTKPHYITRNMGLKLRLAILLGNR